MVHVYLLLHLPFPEMSQSECMKNLNYLTTVFISLPTSAPGEICQTSRGILFPGTGIPPNGGHNDVRWPQREGGLPPGAPLDDLSSGASPSSTVMPMSLEISSVVSGIGLTV